MPFIDNHGNELWYKVEVQELVDEDDTGFIKTIS